MGRVSELRGCKALLPGCKALLPSPAEGEGRKASREDPWHVPDAAGGRGGGGKGGARGLQHLHGFVAQVRAQHGAERAAHGLVGRDPAELSVAVERVVWGREEDCIRCACVRACVAAETEATCERPL